MPKMRFYRTDHRLSSGFFADVEIQYFFLLGHEVFLGRENGGDVLKGDSLRRRNFFKGELVVSFVYRGNDLHLSG